MLNVADSNREAVHFIDNLYVKDEYKQFRNPPIDTFQCTSEVKPFMSSWCNPFAMLNDQSVGVHWE